MENEITRVALYVRVSTDEQAREGYSIEAQKDALIKYAKEHEYKIVDIYVDDGFTARKSMMKRKEFVRMLNDVKAGEIDLILFIKLDRWFRSVRDYYKVDEILEKYGVSWKATQENYDTSTANGRLHVNIRLAIAQDEADRTGERIKFVFQKKVSDGEYTTGKVPLGYKLKNKKLVIDKEKADLARDIFEKYLELGSKHAVVVYFNEIRDERICYTSLTSMLKNRIYVGEYKDNKDFCEALIERKTFDKVQDMLSKTFIRQTNKRRTYLFSGLVYCPHCNNRMTGARNADKKDGTCKQYYRCAKYTMSRHCDYNRSITEADIENYLINHIFDEIENYKAEYEIQKKKSADENILKNRKSNLEKRIAKLKDLYLNDLITIQEYKNDAAKYQQQINDIIEMPNHERKSADTIEQLNLLLQNDFKSIYMMLSRDEKAEFWRNIISKIVPTTHGYSIFFN